ncbi:valine-pyruvate aminotransferase domain protein [Moraxella catarrhalis]|uniref:Valine-pyruvate aminotransferase domain protein n=1 Tax=Moraxella catarrhalis TaxID=480 RepID=A0A3Q9GB49_MORCA|nr:valine-pyruvate aminotransferase domain protein [Moraxella catarrhalis]
MPKTITHLTKASKRLVKWLGGCITIKKYRSSSAAVLFGL